MVRRTFSSIKKVLVKEQNQIISAAAVLMVLALVTKAAGLVYTALFATLDLGKETDMFVFASVLPEAITNIILMGAISASIIPIFIKLKDEKGDSKFFRSFSSTLNMTMIVFIGLSVVIAIFARQIVPVLTTVFNQNKQITPEELDQVVWMIRALLIPQVFLGISSFISTTLNIYNRFIIPQLAPLFFNVGRIFGILVFVPLLGGSIWGLVWGTLLGSFLHLAIQLPLLRHLKIKFSFFYVNLKDKYFKQVLKIGFPRVISLAVEQVAYITDSLIAFGLIDPALTSYYLAVRIVSFPLNLFGTSFAIASFPSLSRLHADGAKIEFRELVNKLINQVLFLSLPVSVILIVMRVPIVRLMYGILAGGFNWENTLQVSWIIMFFALGLSFEGLRSIMFRIYYAIHDSIIPLISSTFVVVFGIITGIAFTNYLSHLDSFSIRELTFNIDYFFTRDTDGKAAVGGLALSSSLVFTLEFFFLLVLLKKKKVLDSLTPIFKDIGKKVIAATVMFIACYAMIKGWEEFLNTTKTLQLILLTFSTMFAAGMVYLWISFVMRIEEVDLFVGFVHSKSKSLYKKGLKYIKKK